MIGRGSSGQPAPAAATGAYRVLVLVSALYGLVFLARIGPGVVTPLLIRRFGVTPVVLSAMTAAQYLAYMLLQPLVGSWGMRFGAGRLLALGAMLDGSGTAAFGASASFTMVVASRALVGAGDALVWISVVLVLAGRFPPGHYGRALGWAGMAGSLGALAATFPLAWWVAAAGWRQPFLVVGAVLALAGAAGWRAFASEGPARAPDSGGPGIGTRIVRRLRHLDRRLLAPMLTHFGFMGTFIGFISLLAVPYLQAAYHLTAATASLYLAMALAGSLAGGPAAGWAGDRYGRRRPYLVAGGLAVVPPVLLAGAFGVLGAVNGATVLTFAVVRDGAGSRVGLEAGLANAAGFLSAVLVPVAMGAVLTALYGRPPAVREAAAFLPALAAALAGLAGAFLIVEPDRRHGAVI